MRVLLVLCVTFFLSTALAWSQTYALLDLGPLTVARGLERDGNPPTIVGTRQLNLPGLFESGFILHPMLKQLRDAMTDLGTQPNAVTGVQVVGLAAFPGATPAERLLHAFIYDDAAQTFVDLGTTGGPTLFSAALAVAVLPTETVVYGHGDSPAQDASLPLRWRNGILEMLPGGSGFVRGSNAAGDGVGGARGSGMLHATLWRLAEGDAVDLHSGPEGLSYALDVNTARTVVGFVSTPTGGRGFVVPAGGTMAQLAPLFGHFESIATSLNDAGVIVGQSLRTVVPDPRPVETAVRWDAAGVVEDLNTLVTPPAPEWVLKSAVRINTAGIIIGTGTKDTVPHSFALIPVPPPPPPPEEKPPRERRGRGRGRPGQP